MLCRFRAGLFVLAFTLTPTDAFGQSVDLSFLSGTYEVVYMPVQSAGRKHGCSLVYKAIALDQVYQNGRPIILIGNITFSLLQRTPALSLKMGIADALAASAAITSAPDMAYLQTASGSTAQSLHEAADVEGYRLFVFKLDVATTKVLGDLLSGEPVTLGFNRRKGGVDILFSLDTTVESATIQGGSVSRNRSPKSVLAFGECVTELVNQIR